jgi:hypothetical protein
MGATVQSLPLHSTPIVAQGNPYYYSGGVYYAPQADSYAIVPPPRGAVIPSVPDSATTVSGAGQSFNYSNGVFYQQANKGYQIVEPPPGILITSLPKGAVTVTVNTVNYREFGGVWYQPFYSGSEVICQTDSQSDWLRASPNRASTGDPKARFLNKEGHKDLKEVILVLLSPRTLQKTRPFGPMSGLNTTFFGISVVLTLNFAHFREDSSRAKAALPRRHADTPTRRHADTPTRRYADTPIRRYADTPIRRYNRHMWLRLRRAVISCSKVCLRDLLLDLFP